MKKKFVFVMINMNVGGTEKALLNMIAEMPKDRYDITILIFDEHGAFLNQIPHDVRVELVKGGRSIKDAFNNPPQITALNFLRKGNIIKAFNIALLHLVSKVVKERSLFLSYIFNDSQMMEDEFDVAVSYFGTVDFISYFVLNKIKAKKKIQWIHFDVEKIGLNQRFASKTYNKFDKIFVVSKDAKTKLINMVPNIKEKTDVFFNVISSRMIQSQAKEGNGFNDKFEGLRILTIGRLSVEKGQDLAIRVLAKLVDNGYQVKWYCIGEGNFRKNYEKLIEEYNLKDKFILLGTEINPYPYLKQCDIYVQPSRHEGYCITLAEARCLNKPIVTTDFTGAKEQIKDGKTGRIVTSKEEDIYNALEELINNSKLRDEFSGNLAKEVVNATCEMGKLYDILK